jgi:DNA-binding FrmR family transcriptional regulator
VCCQCWGRRQPVVRVRDRELARGSVLPVECSYRSQARIYYANESEPLDIPRGGIIRSIQKVSDWNTYPRLKQIAAVQSALNGVGKLLLEGHMRSCVIERIQSGETEVIEELLITVNKRMK